MWPPVEHRLPAARVRVQTLHGHPPGAVRGLQPLRPLYPAPNRRHAGRGGRCRQSAREQNPHRRTVRRPRRFRRGLPLRVNRLPASASNLVWNIEF